MPGTTIKLTALDWVPPFAQGQVRDLRVRWALEEAGIPYEAIILDQGTLTDPQNVARQPFGQVPAIEIDGRTMFESGAIVWKIAEASATLLPRDPAVRDRVLCWLFASLDSVEPPIGALADLDFFVEDAEVKAKLRPRAVAAVETRLAQLQDALGGRDHLVGDFSAADLMMTTVLRILDHTDILERFPALARYVERHTARPAFARALACQMQPFKKNAARYENAA